MKIFDMDGPFQYYGGILFDLLISNLIWIFISVFSFGILSGPATLALYQSVYRGILLKDGYPFKTFFLSFKTRFFYQLGFCFFYFAMMLLTVMNLYLTLTGQFGTIWLLPVYFFIFMELALTGTVAFPLLSQNRDLRFLDLLKISFIIANKHLPWVFLATIPNVILVVLVVLTFSGYLQLTIFLFFFPALNALAISQFVLKKVLERYQHFKTFQGNFF